MKYYIVKHANDLKTTGSTFPQIQKIDPPQNYTSKDSIYKFSFSISKFPEGHINTNYLVLEHRAILTDVLSASMLGANGFLLSEKAKNLLEQFIVSPSKYYEVGIRDSKGNVYEYYWLHVLNIFESTSYEDSKYKYVDFDKTEFGVFKSLRLKRGVEINSLK